MHYKVLSNKQHKDNNNIKYKTMENINPKNILPNDNSRNSLKLGIKLLLILIISVLLLIPQAIIMDMVNEGVPTW